MVLGKIIPVLKDIRQHIKWVLASLWAYSSVMFGIFVYNYFNLVPESLTFLVVLWNRSFFAIYFAITFIYSLALKPMNEKYFAKPSKSESEVSNNNNNDKTNNEEESAVEFNFFKGFARLTFAIYVFNYLTIRAIFFTSRNTFPATLSGSVS